MIYGSSYRGIYIIRKILQLQHNLYTKNLNSYNYDVKYYSTMLLNAKGLQQSPC